MGVNFRDLVVKHPLSFEELSGKRVVVDGYNMLYQFLSNIRSRDGNLLTDSKGRVTSHLVGLFSRVCNLMSKGLKLVFVFDGVPPSLKHKLLARRAQIKKEAQLKYEAAIESEDEESMKKFASRTSRLTKEMVEEAKLLLVALGLPVVQAPSEGEAQAAHIVSRGDAWAVVSQDYDSLLYGSSRLIHNLSVEGRRKVPGKFAFVKIEPSVIVLDEFLVSLGLSREQLLWLAILVGTDYNPAGVKGIGPKKGLALVKSAKSAEELFSRHQLADDVDWREVISVFQNMPVADDYVLKWNSVDRKAVERVLLDHDFSLERIEKSLSLLVPVRSQTGLGDFL